MSNLKRNIFFKPYIVHKLLVLDRNTWNYNYEQIIGIEYSYNWVQIISIKFWH